MELQYCLFNPTGNITALVDTEIPVEFQPKAAEYILAKEPLCEQVGFVSEGIEGADITLRMAGGEFCGNATMSTAVFYCKKQGFPIGTQKVIKVKVIGTTGLVPVDVSVEKDHVTGRLKMPAPLKITEETLSYAEEKYVFPIVHFYGISHIIATDEMSVYTAEHAIKVWCDRLKVKGLGIMIVNDKRTTLRPLVYVKVPETMFWESSCASGTTAAGAYFAKLEGKPCKYTFSEPGGSLSIEVTEDGSYYLCGKVEEM